MPLAWDSYQAEAPRGMAAVMAKQEMQDMLARVVEKEMMAVVAKKRGRKTSERVARKEMLEM